jgi:hypothetical protein
MANIPDTRIPLKTPRVIDVAVSTITPQSIQFVTGLASTPPVSPERPPAYNSPPHIRDLHEVKKAACSLWEPTRYPLHSNLKELKPRRLTWNPWINIMESSGEKPGCKQHKSIPQLRHNNNWATTPLQKVNIFSSLLSEQFTPNPIEDLKHNTNDLQCHRTSPTIHLIFLCLRPCRCEIQLIDYKKTNHLDMIWLYNHYYNIYQRKHLFSLHRYITPYCVQLISLINENKQLVWMVHKQGKDRQDPKSYRPISLLSIFFSKLFERLLMPQLLNLQLKNLIIFFRTNSLVLELVTPAHNNCTELQMSYWKPMNQNKFVWDYFWTQKKHSTEFGTKSCIKN